jgi:hypothetical protein
MRVFLRSSFACLVLFGAGCTIGDGDFDGFDGSPFDDEDGGEDRDAARRDAAGEDDDSGTPSTRDAGTDAGDAGGEPNEPTLTAADVPNLIARGRCGALEACIGKTLLGPVFENNDCVDFTTRQLADRHLHYLGASISAGRVTFRASALEACRKAIVALGCDVTSRPLPAECEDAIEGEVELDHGCNIDQDCKGDAYCDKGMQETCPGTCAPLQAAGLPCNSSTQCASGLMCLGSSCRTPLSEGDACQNRIVNSECPPGLVCQGRDGDETCQSIETLYSAKLGEDCDLYGKLCEVGLVCASQSAQNTQGKCAQPSAAGTTCRRAEPNQCPATQYCKTTSASSMERATPGSDGVCAERPAAGQSCEFSASCKPGARCIGEQCRALQSAGGTCGANAECYGGLCEQEVCVITTLDCSP